MTLHKVTPLSDNPEFVEAFSSVVRDSLGHVCEVCGLERMGHAPESEWLGYERHAWAPVPADDAAIRRARDLTVAAYRARNACGHQFAGPACKRGECIHPTGHCEHCN